MRRKIAKRKRKYILSKGAEIVCDRWEKDLDFPNDRYFVAKVDYLGWHITSTDRDELSAYQGVIACFPSCEGNPRTEDGE